MNKHPVKMTAIARGLRALPIAASLLMATTLVTMADDKVDSSRLVSVGGDVTEIIYALGEVGRVGGHRASRRKLDQGTQHGGCLRAPWRGRRHGWARGGGRWAHGGRRAADEQAGGQQQGRCHRAALAAGDSLRVHGVVVVLARGAWGAGACRILPKPGGGARRASARRCNLL